MAREKISQAEVSAAADKIMANGLKVTIKALYDALKADTGRGGSYSDLGPLFESWKLSKGGGATAEPIRIDVPTSIRERSDMAMVEMWSVAMDMANDKLRAEREAMDAERKKFQSDVTDGLAALDVIQGEKDALQITCKDLRDEVKSLGEQLTSSKVVETALTDKLHQAEAALKERQRQIDGITEERKSLEKTVRDLTEKTGKQHQQIDQLRTEAARVKDLENDVRRLEKEKATTEAQLSGAQIRTNDANQRRDAVEADMKKLHDEVRALNTQLQEALRKKAVKPPVKKLEKTATK